MDKIIEFLSSIKTGIDFSVATDIVTGGILDSIGITALITMLEDEYDIEIGMEYMENANFDSVEAIWNMVEELR